ncbi:MAG: acetyl-CoA carboxylase carboxyltransferase subunit alpha [Armatimonadetes bacterium]|nr:acetyl-CoA carboxylase carboxyltransferase subunit alpha [Armatimonadota bacterium]
MSTAPKTWKEWEKPLIELEEALGKLQELANRATGTERDRLLEKIKGFEKRRDRYLDTKYHNLSAWEEVLLARAEPRPYTLDYINALFRDFIELQGDRRHGPDNAILGGPAFFNGQRVMVVGHQKGRTISERTHRNFAMSRPEGYRKAIRLFEMADRFNLPVISFIDTPAADPSVESESRGISEAIAASMLSMFELRVPTIAVVIGEGGSGGAIGIGIGNKVLMMEHAIYSVIPPEGCAAILWRAPERGAEAADALRLTSRSALELGLADEIIPEPRGGAHRDPAVAAESVGAAIQMHLDQLCKMSPDALKQHRYERFRSVDGLREASPSDLPLGK